MSDRKVYPANNSVGSDLFTVLTYDPIHQTCDLAPASVNQRGVMTQVPIAQTFAGAWENQQFHRPAVAKTDSKTWGTAPRGARWGMNLPIQPGDLALVLYAGESASDPVIVAFYRWRGDYAVPWLANQVIGTRDNEFKKALPQDDAETADRFDVLLPSGGWLRSTKLGSWVMATGPVDAAKAWLVLDQEGRIKLKARSKDGDYTVHLEMDAVQQCVRLAFGESDNTSHIELNKAGDIVLRARRNIQVHAQEFKVDLAPQADNAIARAIAPLRELAQNTPDEVLKPLAYQAAADLLKAGVAPDHAAATLFSDQSIEAATRRRIETLALNPNLVGDTLKGFVNGMKPEAILGQLNQVLGANILSGGLTDLVSKLNLENLAESLNIPSWIGKSVQQFLGGAAPIETTLNLNEALNPRQLLTEACRHLGCLCLNGMPAEAARKAVLKDGGDRLFGSLNFLTGLPLPAVPNDGRPQDLLQTVAQRLGRYVLSGEDDLGGVIGLFDQINFDGLNLASDTTNSIKKIASQIEQQFANGAIAGLERLPQQVLDNLGALTKVPSEIRNLIPQLEDSLADLLPQLANLKSLGSFESLQDIASGLAGIDSSVLSLFKSPDAILQNLQKLPQQLADQFLQAPKALLEDVTSLVKNPAKLLDFANSEGLAKIAEQLKDLPSQVLESVKALPQQLLGSLGGVDALLKSAVLSNPQAALAQLALGQLGGFLGGKNTIGLFKVNSVKRGQSLKHFPIPVQGKKLEPLASAIARITTEKTEISRFLEYGTLELQNYFAKNP